jgi:hypothetical protein
MNDRIPHTETDLVLAGVKAQPLRGGLRPSLDPGLRASSSASQREPANRPKQQDQVSTVSGDCRSPICHAFDVLGSWLSSVEHRP